MKLVILYIRCEESLKNKKYRIITGTVSFPKFFGEGHKINLDRNKIALCLYV